jgi:hypothetical protein
MTTEGEEMEVTGALKSFQSIWHSEHILLPP